jgi:ribosomal RNA-processing protein 8
MCPFHLFSYQSLALQTQDKSNSYFTLFEFEKTSHEARGEKDWNKLLTKGDMLKPCEYKRR